MLRRIFILIAVVALGACRHPASAPSSGKPSRARLAVTTKERWRVPLPSERIGIPDVEADAVYLTTADSVVALDHQGSGIWSTPFVTRIYAPRVDGDSVFVAGETGVVALRRATGDVLWRFDTGERVNRPAVTDGVVVVTTDGGRVLGLDRGSGAVRWDTRLATQSGAEPALGDRVAVVVGLGEWAGFDITTGAKIWSGDLGIIGTSSPAVVPTAKEQLAVVATQNKLVAVGLHDGELRWNAAAEQSELAQVPVVEHGDLLVPDHWGRLAAYRPADGAVVWKAKGADGVSLWGQPVPLGRHRVALALAKDGPRIAASHGTLALRPPSPGLGVTRLPDGALLVSTWGRGQNYLVAYDIDVGS